MAPWRKAKQQFQLIFKFDASFSLAHPVLLYRRGHPKQAGFAGESVNLLSKKPKKKKWKVKAAPENPEEDEDEVVREVG